MGVVAALGSLALLYLSAVWTATGQAVDTSLMVSVAAALQGAGWTETLLWLVSPVLVVYLTAVVALVASLSDGVRSAVTCTAVVGATLVASEVLKAVLVRPSWLDTAGNSLPNGHVAAVAALTAAAVLAAPHRARLAVGVLGAAVVAATGIATMAEGWHRPSDVIAAVLIALAVGLVMWAHQDHSNHTAPDTSVDTTPTKEQS